MKNLRLVIRLAGVMFVSTGVGRAGDKPAPPAVPAVKKDSGHVVPAPATKQAAPNRISPPLSKPALPVDAGKLHGTASTGGPSARKDGKLNGTDIKRHP